MIERASHAAAEESPQLEVAKAILDFASTDDGRDRFGDPESGSTLEQIWRLRLSSDGVRLVCLVVMDRDGLTTSAIPTVAQMDAKQLVGTLARLFAADPSTSIHPFVFDGDRGYAMTLLGYDPATSTFTVNEPRSTESTIDTARADDGSWVLSAEQLTHVVCAVFLPPPLWADLNNVSYQIKYSALQESQLWSFFGVRETKRHEIANGQTIALLEPGGFKKENRLQMRLDKAGRVRGAVLLQARPWMMSQSGMNPFALDLAKGFIKELTPEPDDTSDLVSGLWALKSMEELNELNVMPSSEIGAFLQAYMGAHPEAWLLKDFVKLQAKTITHEDIKFMQLQMDHW